MNIEEWKNKNSKDRLEYLSKFWQCNINDNNTLTLVGKYNKAKEPDKNGNYYGIFTDLRDLNGD